MGVLQLLQSRPALEQIGDQGAVQVVEPVQNFREYRFRAAVRRLLWQVSRLPGGGVLLPGNAAGGSPGYPAARGAETHDGAPTNPAAKPRHGDRSWRPTGRMSRGSALR